MPHIPEILHVRPALGKEVRIRQAMRKISLVEPYQCRLRTSLPHSAQDRRAYIPHVPRYQYLHIHSFPLSCYAWLLCVPSVAPNRGDSSLQVTVVSIKRVLLRQNQRSANHDAIARARQFVPRERSKTKRKSLPPPRQCLHFASVVPRAR